MKTGEFLDSIASRVEASMQRMETLRPRLAEKLNVQPDRKSWSPGQIVRHMNMSVEEYLPRLRVPLASAPKSSAESEVHHTWIGKQIIKGAGPDGNVPAPGKLQPPSETYTESVIEEWFKLHRELIDLAKKSKDVDLNQVPFKNPIIKIIRMNAADAFAVLAAHAERHVGQLESRT